MQNIVTLPAGYSDIFGASSLLAGPTSIVVKCTIFRAVEDKNLSKAKELLENNKDKEAIVNEYDTKEGITSLMRAAQEGDYKMVVLLLQNGANVNVKSRNRTHRSGKNGWTALMFAEDSKDIETIKILEEHVKKLKN